MIVLFGAFDPISNIRQPGLFGLALLSKVLVTLYRAVTTLPDAPGLNPMSALPKA
jgi:hypothetical protein